MAASEAAKTGLTAAITATAAAFILISENRRTAIFELRERERERVIETVCDGLNERGEKTI